MKNKTLSAVLILIGCLFLNFANAQNQHAYKIGLVGFYNLENLFDTIDDPNINDEEFLPNGGEIHV